MDNVDFQCSCQLGSKSSEVFSENRLSAETSIEQLSISNGDSINISPSIIHLGNNNNTKLSNLKLDRNPSVVDKSIQNSTLPNIQVATGSIQTPDTVMSAKSTSALSRFPVLNDRCLLKDNKQQSTFSLPIFPNRRPQTIDSQISFCSIDSSVSTRQNNDVALITPTDNKSMSYQLPTVAKVKKRKFLDKLFTTLGIIYALLIITIGVTLYLLDYLDLQRPELHFIAEWFSLIILSFALFYCIYLIIDITKYLNKMKQLHRLLEEIPMEQIELEVPQIHNYNKDKMEKIEILQKELNHHRYCFKKDRHSCNFYLKIGATAFCFGHLIHSILILTYRGIIVSTTDSESDSWNCVSPLTYTIDVLYPIYSLLLLFFIFKYSNVIINANISLHRMCFLHCMATNLCCWIWTIFRETAEYVQYQHQTTYNINQSAVSITPRRFTETCNNADLNVLYQNYSPYLYPFSVEYSILSVGILYITWTNIGLCSSATSIDTSRETRQCQNYETMAEGIESHMTLHVDCHASNRGFFSGFIVLVFAIGSVVLFFITFYHDTSDLADLGHVINESVQSTILALMSVCSILAYRQLYKLDVNDLVHNNLDNFLLLMCLPAFFIYALFSLSAAAFYSNKLAIIRNSAELIQILIQTPLTIDAMSKSSNSKKLRKLKPGRAAIIFLVICNVAMWLMQTFEVKSHGLDQYRQEFYSKEFWSIVGHMCLPLIMFYRFHSSACLCDVWKYAYVPAGH